MIRKKKTMKIKNGSGFLVLTGFTIVAVVTVFLIGSFWTTYKVDRNWTFEIGSEVRVAELFEFADDELKVDDRVDTSKLGDNVATVSLSGPFGTRRTIEASYTVVDTVVPVIEGEDEIEIFENESLNLLERFSVHDNSLGDVPTKVEGDCDTAVIGVCEMKIIAQDQSGNETIRDVTIKVIASPSESSQNVTESSAGATQNVASAVARPVQNEYYVKVNRLRNVVMVYALDDNGEYTKLVKTFVGSTGKVGSETPLGVYRVADRYEALYLVGDVWGHYAVRISGPYFFHSVPYFSKGDPSWDDLEYLEYNKLGEGASAGCVRLAVRDAKWIYDNVAAGTVVEIYDSEVLPDGVVKPSAIKIDESSDNRGWDPTDADLMNPWNK